MWCRPSPMRLRLGQLEERAQMPQRAALWSGLDTDGVELVSGEVEVQPWKRHLALAVDEHARLAQRYTHMIAAALQCPLGECEEDAVGSEIAGGVVAGRRWQQSRAV